MHFSTFFRLALIGALFTCSPLHAATTKEKTPSELGEITRTVARMLESAHYNRQRLNDEVTPGVTQARLALDRYLELLDYNHLFFTQEDVQEFQSRFGDSLQDDIMLGNLKPAYEIHDRFLSRLTQRVEKIKSELKNDFSFDSDRSVQINRDKLSWPTNDADADKIWRDRIEAEVLQATLANKAIEEAAQKKKEKKAKAQSSPSENASPAPNASDSTPTAAGTSDASSASENTSHKPANAEPAAKSEDVVADEAAPALPKRTPKEQVQRRYERLLKAFKEENREDAANRFLSALTQSYDPHSEYMSQRSLDSFNILMGLSLVGIGAELRNDDGYAKIQRLIPGGPAERGGILAVNDRIAAVAQGNDEFEDVVDMTLDRVVERIRGKKGTTVRLQVLPANSSDPSKLKIVSIVRDEVKLKDEEAKAKIIEVPSEKGEATKVGWITLPSFYANMDRSGSPKSTTKDVAKLLKRLKQEGIEGLVIDLRKDAGGSLDEAVRLTGLFIPKGPVVQVKDTNGNITPLNDPDPGMLWDGPMIVLTNRLSASASEIFAAALQDYGRAIIVGDEKTFGKGTVQSLIEVDRFMPLFASAKKSGAVKLTIQKFYRIKGGSTQLHGVNADIVLPSLTDHADVGEGALKNPLEYDEVPPRRFDASGTLDTTIPRLRSLSEARVAANPEFDYIKEDSDRISKRIEKNIVSLNKQKRQEEIDTDKARRDARNAERKTRNTPALAAVEVTLDTIDAKQLQKVALDKPPKRSGYGDEDEIDEDTEDPTAPDEKEPFVDPVRDEALLILTDFIHTNSQAPVTASALAPASNTQ